LHNYLAFAWEGALKFKKNKVKACLGYPTRGLWYGRHTAPSHGWNWQKSDRCRERENMREAQIHFVYSVCIMEMRKDLAFYFSQREFTLLQEIDVNLDVRDKSPKILLCLSINWWKVVEEVCWVRCVIYVKVMLASFVHNSSVLSLHQPPFLKWELQRRRPFLYLSNL
jgi:hypothetical protein